MQRDIPLHDIKPLVEVPDYSLEILIGLAVLVCVLLVLIVVWIRRFSTGNEEKRLRTYHLERLHAVDLSSPKQAAYEISYYGRLLAKEDRAKELLESLDSRLEAYKYKKDVGTLDEDVLAYYKLFVEVVDAA